MDFRDVVWKRVWKLTFVGLKQGQDLENPVAHPQQEFPIVPPPPRIMYHCKIIYIVFLYLGLPKSQNPENPRRIPDDSLVLGNWVNQVTSGVIILDNLTWNLIHSVS